MLLHFFLSSGRPVLALSRFWVEYLAALHLGLVGWDGGITHYFRNTLRDLLQSVARPANSTPDMRCWGIIVPLALGWLLKVAAYYICKLVQFNY